MGIKCAKTGWRLDNNARLMKLASRSFSLTNLLLRILGTQNPIYLRLVYLSSRKLSNRKLSRRKDSDTGKQRQLSSGSNKNEKGPGFKTAETERPNCKQ